MCHGRASTITSVWVIVDLIKANKRPCYSRNRFGARRYPPDKVSSTIGIVYIILPPSTAIPVTYPSLAFVAKPLSPS